MNHDEIVKDINERYPEIEEVILYPNLAEAYSGLAWGGPYPRALYDFDRS